MRSFCGSNNIVAPVNMAQHLLQRYLAGKPGNIGAGTNIYFASAPDERNLIAVSHRIAQSHAKTFLICNGRQFLPVLIFWKLQLLQLGNL